MDDFIGIVKLFAGNFAPVDWLFCNGQTLRINDHTALFTLLGTTYGGDGMTTFALPDLRGRVPVGAGQGIGVSGYYEGQAGGTENVTLLTANIPAHSHATQLLVSKENASMDVAVAGSSIATPGAGGRTFTATLGFNSTDPDVVLNNKSIKTEAVGSNVPVNVVQPYVALNYIICINGIFPRRP